MAVTESLRAFNDAEVEERPRPRRREVVEWSDGPLWTDNPREDRATPRHDSAPRHDVSLRHESAGRYESAGRHDSAQHHDSRHEHHDSRHEQAPARVREGSRAHEAARTHRRSPLPHRADGSAPLADSGVTTEGRRTVVITGRGAERYPAPRRGYESRLRPHERSGFKPDRVAMWAVLLGVALLLAAVTSAHAAVLHAVAGHLAAR